MTKPSVAVRLIDASVEKNVALLHWMQLEILPADEPIPTFTGLWWVATIGSQPLAFAGMRQSAQWTDAGYLCRAGVMPSARGMGLQRRLIKTRERKARSLGFRWLITDTLDNPISANNLIACGFKMFTPTNPWGIVNTCYWKKGLK